MVAQLVDLGGREGAVEQLGAIELAVEGVGQADCLAQRDGARRQVTGVLLRVAVQVYCACFGVVGGGDEGPLPARQWRASVRHARAIDVQEQYAVVVETEDEGGAVDDRL